MSRAKGFGVANHRIHWALEEMDSEERTAFELKLKKDNPQRYKEFKEWQKHFMKVLPKHKIDY